MGNNCWEQLCGFAAALGNDCFEEPQPTALGSSFRKQLWGTLGGSFRSFGGQLFGAASITTLRSGFGDCGAGLGAALGSRSSFEQQLSAATLRSSFREKV